jgi:hypothetical protein
MKFYGGFHKYVKKIYVEKQNFIHPQKLSFSFRVETHFKTHISVCIGSTFFKAPHNLAQKHVLSFRSTALPTKHGSLSVLLLRYYSLWEQFCRGLPVTVPESAGPDSDKSPAVPLFKTVYQRGGLSASDTPTRR